MLTESELVWLKDRRNKVYCRYCSVIYLCSNPSASGFKCPLIPDYKDAAEFSERVAEKLAYLGAGGYGLGVNAHNMMMYCRLAVEEEMDG